MRFAHSIFIISCLIIFLPTSLFADGYHEQTKLLTYSPRYFGPNAFPVPQLRSGKVSSLYELEVRGEYHYFSGDKTKNIHTRVLLPFVKGRAGVEVSLNLFEDYKMTPEIVEERHAVGATPPITCHGDVVVSAFFQVLTSEKWMDITVDMNLKTASGGRLCDARYTDAAAYWFDLTLGKDLVKSAEDKFKLRLQAMVGFYCWMTNDYIHRQNDALSYGVGLTANYRNFTFLTDVAGFDGYKSNGDDSMVWRNNLRYEFKKNIVSFRYHHGMVDNLYDTVSLGYIRCF